MLILIEGLIESIVAITTAISGILTIINASQKVILASIAGAVTEINVIIQVYKIISNSIVKYQIQVGAQRVVSHSNKKFKELNSNLNV